MPMDEQINYEVEEQLQVNRSSNQLLRRFDSNLLKQPKYLISPDWVWRERWDWFVLVVAIYSCISVCWSVAFVKFDSGCCGSKIPLSQYMLEMSQQCQSDEGIEPGDDFDFLYGGLENFWNQTQQVYLEECDVRNFDDFQQRVIKYQLMLPCYARSTFVMDLLADIVFWIEIVLTFFVGYRLPNSFDIVWDRKLIAVRYLKSMFVLDFVATFPFDKIFQKALKGLLVLQLTKLTRLVRLSRLWKKLDQLAEANTLRVIKLLMAYCMIAHVVACLMFFIGRWQGAAIEWQIAGKTIGGMNIYTGDPWLFTQCLQYASSTTQYSLSLYWSFTTLTTVGYGDIMPITNMDRVFIIFIMVLGGILQAITFGNISVLVQNIDGAKRRLIDQTNQMKEIIRNHALPEDLQNRVLDSVQYQWHHSKGLNTEEILSNLPTQLKGDILMDMQQELSYHRTIFSQLGDKQFMRSLISLFKSVTFVPDDYVVEFGDQAMALYYIQDGTCRLMSQDEAIEFSKVSRGEFVGELECLLGLRRTSTVRTCSYATMLELDICDLKLLFKEYPQYVNILKRKAQMRNKELNKSKMILLDRANTCSHFNEAQQKRISVMKTELEKSISEFLEVEGIGDSAESEEVQLLGKRKSTVGFS